MSDRDEFPIEGDPVAGTRFQIPQASRDLQSNWELNLAKNLEDYLLKICSGEVQADQESSINFAEAALLLQGSVQVYSRKVEYLHSLVLAALEFLSQKRQDQQEKTSVQPDGNESNAVIDDEDEAFLGLDDVPVEAKNCLDRGLDKDNSNHFVKPPANLLVLEGDCLDSSGDASELESYLLSTCNFYKDFLLLDPCDAGAVNDFLKSDGLGQEQPALHKGSSARSKNRHSYFTSPNRRPEGTPYKSSLGKNQGGGLNGTSENNYEFETNNENVWSEPSLKHHYPADDMCHEEEPNFGCSDGGDDTESDNDDPWKPLNPHESGNLKIKPFKLSKPFGRQVICNSKHNTVASQFPVAKVGNIISPDLAELFEVQLHLKEMQNASQSPPYFEKLRRSFTNSEENFDDLGGIDDESDDNGVDNFPNFDNAEFDQPNNAYDMATEISPNPGKKYDAAKLDGIDAFTQDDLGSQASLEDLCRSHLDALLASIAETEKQTELATRVSTWKQRIEKTLEEQDAHSPFDIHQYGDAVLDKLSLEADSGGSMSFTDVVMGQPKHDVARTFSALLQLVNNGDVDLQRPPSGNSKLICYTAENPFRVKLLRSNKKKEEMIIRSARKRVKSPLRDHFNSEADPSTSEAISPSKFSRQNGRSSVKPAKGTVTRFTPDGKRPRRSRLAQNGDLQPG